MTLMRKHPLLTVAILSVVLSFVAFGNGISGDFVFDDTAVVEKRGELKDGSNLLNLLVSPYHQNTPQTGLYRPVTMVSYSLNYLIIGNDPTGFHVINILIHALNVLLVFWLVKYLFKSDLIAGLTSLFFLLHPIHTEAVTSIVGRAELLMFLFSLLAVTLFIKKRFILSALVFLLALGSKESALMILPILLFMEIVYERKKIAVAIKEMLFLAIPSAIYAIFRYIALGSHFLNDVVTTQVENPLKFADFSTRIFTAFKILYLYLQKLVWPVNLSADYSFDTIKLVDSFFSSYQAVMGLLIFLALIFLLLGGQTRRSIWAFCAFVFLIPYLLFSNLIITIGTIMAERLLYLSSLGFVLAIAYVLSKGMENKQKDMRVTSIAFLFILVFSYSYISIDRNRDWQTNETLLASSFEQSQEGVITLTGLAGVALADNRDQEAQDLLEKVFEIYDSNAHAWNLYGGIAQRMGDSDLAEERYKKSISLSTRPVNQYINLSNLYFKEGRVQESADALLQVIEFNATPQHVSSYAYLVVSLGRHDDAIGLISKYFGEFPEDGELNAALGTAFFSAGKHDQALIYLLRAKERGIVAKQVDQFIEIIEGSLGN